jgi:hypothetical protein
MMLQIVNLFQSIAWIGGCESIDKSVRRKFGKAQELACEICLEFDSKVKNLCQTSAATSGNCKINERMRRKVSFDEHKGKEK